ncbi:MAG: type II secretion system protein [Candidatus Roizmanbacteria bacterium]
MKINNKCTIKIENSFFLKQKKGFTLIEILVVATIISLLAIGAAVSYQGLGAGSRDARRKSDVEQVRAAIELFRNSNTVGSYPDSAELSISCASSGGVIDGSNTYLSKIPLDPRCTTYTYSYTPLPSGCDSSSSTTPCLDYTIGAYLEKTTSASCTSGAECGQDCNYCLGANGEK